MSTTALDVSQPGDLILGVIVPAAVFVFSIVVTYLLYRHFSKR